MFLPVIKPVFRLVFKILSYILFLLTLIAAYCGRINPNWLGAPEVLVLAFPYLVVASVVAIVIWLCCGRYITAGIGIAMLVAIWGSVSTVSPLHLSKKPENPDKTFKLLTYNIIHGSDLQNGDDSPGNRTFDYIMKSGADIVCLQEMCSFSQGEIPNYNSFCDSLYTIYPYRAGTTANDQKVLSKYPVRMVEYSRYLPQGFNTIWFSIYEVDIKGITLTLFNMHLISFQLNDKERNVMKEVASVSQTEDGLKELQGSILDKIKRYQIERLQSVKSIREAIAKVKGPLIICGDFNDVPESFCYRTLRGEDLRDAYVETSFGPMVTYNKYALWFHLDQIFYRGPLQALSVEKGRLRSSDHYPLIASFEILSNN